MLHIQIGDLVRFTASVYNNLGIGLVIREHEIVDRDGTQHRGYYCVLTQRGQKVISQVFMEKLS